MRLYRRRPERTTSGVRKPPPESSVPGENQTRGSRRNQLRRGHGSPPVLSEVPHELSIPLRAPKSANGPRSNSFRPDSPSTTNLPRGRKAQPAPSPYRTWSVPDASSGPWLNLHYALAAACPNCYARLHGRTKKVDYSTKKTYTIFVCSKIRMIENNKAETT